LVNGWRQERYNETIVKFMMPISCVFPHPSNLRDLGHSSAGARVVRFPEFRKPRK
jgi:hypothetical protein